MSKRVPTKLHHELVEYASLLRALRVRDTLDVTKHLTKANPFKIQPEDDAELNSGDDFDSDEEPVVIGSNRGPSTSISLSPDPGSSTVKSAKARGKQKAVDSGIRKQRRRDHWTRWPVRVDDVLKPEWSLEDEVAVIVSQVMKGRPSPTFPVPVADADEGEDEDDPMFPVRDFEFDEEDPDHPFYVPYITASVAEYLSNILGALAGLIPARAASMQNRIEPLGWRAIVDVVVACTKPEFANPKVVENVIKRMEALYGPSILPLEGEKSTSLRPVERMLDKEAARKKLSDKLDEEVAKYWEVHPSDMLETLQQPLKKETGKRRRSAMDEHMEAEFKGRTKRAPPKKKRRAVSKMKPTESATSTSRDSEVVPVDYEVQSPPATESREQPHAQAGPSHQGQPEAPVRRSTRSRRTNEVQVLNESVFMG